MYFVGVWGLTASSYAVYHYTTDGHKDLWRVYVCIYNIFVYFQCNRNIQDAPCMVLGMVHYNRTVVVLLHKCFSSWLSTFCNSISIIMNCTYTTMSESNIAPYTNNSFHLFQVDCLFLISLQYWLSIMFFFHLDCTRCCRFTFLTHFGSKSQCRWTGNYICCVIILLA